MRKDSCLSPTAHLGQRWPTALVGPFASEQVASLPGTLLALIVPGWLPSHICDVCVRHPNRKVELFRPARNLGGVPQVFAGNGRGQILRVLH